VVFCGRWVTWAPSCNNFFNYSLNATLKWWRRCRKCSGAILALVTSCAGSSSLHFVVEPSGWDRLFAMAKISYYSYFLLLADKLNSTALLFVTDYSRVVTWIFFNHPGEWILALTLEFRHFVARFTFKIPTTWLETWASSWSGKRTLIIDVAISHVERPCTPTEAIGDLSLLISYCEV
jgi:hypothetical protein